VIQVAIVHTGTSVYEERWLGLAGVSKGTRTFIHEAAVCGVEMTKPVGFYFEYSASCTRT